MAQLTIQEAKGLYAKTGFCEHTFVDESHIPKTNVHIINCIVCAKEIQRWYS